MAYGSYKFIRRINYISISNIPIAEALEEARNDSENESVLEKKKKKGGRGGTFSGKPNSEFKTIWENGANTIHFYNAFAKLYHKVSSSKIGNQDIINRPRDCLEI